MKYRGTWWGVWLEPESEADRSLLVQLYESIKAQFSGYEGGEPEFSDGTDGESPVGSLVLPR
jgi:hypothetical protein